MEQERTLRRRRRSIAVGVTGIVLLFAAALGILATSVSTIPLLVVMIVANSTGREDVEAYRGLAWRGGIVPAVALTIFLFSLTGIPLTIGFIGKFYLFAAVIRGQFYLLAIVGILNSVVSLYYYVKPIRMMFFEQPRGDEGTVRFEAWNYGLMGILACATIVFGLYWSPIISFANRSLNFFTGPT